MKEILHQYHHHKVILVVLLMLFLDLVVAAQELEVLIHLQLDMAIQYPNQELVVLE
jgi:hypothetical protein